MEELAESIDHENVHAMANDFQNALLKAATTHVGTVRPGRGTRSWVTPKVREAIRHRNRLRQHIGSNRSEWLEACRAARNAIIEAKTEAWKKVLADSDPSCDDSKMWKVIRSLNGTPESNSPNEAMAYRGRLITSNKRKADIFVNHYSTISKVQLSKEDRAEHRSLKSKLREARTTDASVQPFTLSELRNAIQRMKSRGAPGPDRIPPTFLKHLGPKALRKLLELFNMSLRTSVTPQSWRNATIIPLLKTNKPPSDLASFRPISLTSCVAKLMERMLSDRLYDLGERSGCFSELQAGFRKGRGVEDQILRVTQRITDGFHNREKSLLVLLDFSKAYDTIWRQRLLLTLLKRGIPKDYVLWLANFLENRQARGKFNGSVSKSKIMTQGLPQGAVLAPVLFLFYINELALLLPKNVLTAMYADDVSILASAKSTATAELLAQKAVDTVVDWSKDWKLNLNGNKSESAIFSMANADKSWVPNILISGSQVRCVPYPRFLGVTLDCRLTFSKHIEELTSKVARKSNILRAVANSTWGWRKDGLRRVYLSHIHSVFNYAGSGWQPWISNTNIKALETAQNRCLRLISTQALSAPVEALRAETGVNSISSAIESNTLKSREKALRLPADHPRRLAFEGCARQRLKKSCARSRAVGLSSKIPGQPSRAPLLYFNTRPWDRGLTSVSVFSSLPGISSREDCEEAIQRAALSRAEELNADYNLYSDGSADAGTTKGGAGVVITTGDPAHPTVVETIKVLGAPLTCSYEEELRAMHSATDWVSKHLKNTQSAAVFTDSQSLCTALVGNSPALDPLRTKLNNLPCQLTIQWIPGHCNIPGNELADAAAKSATSIKGSSPGVSYSSICSQIRTATKDPPIQHPRTRQVYAALSPKTESQVESRADQSLLAKLRSGHCMGLRHYRSVVDGVTDPICDLCRESPQTLEHWLQSCPKTARQRWDLFGGDSGRLDCLTRYPRESLALARSTLDLGARRGNNSASFPPA